MFVRIKTFFGKLSDYVVLPRYYGFISVNAHLISLHVVLTEMENDFNLLTRYLGFRWYIKKPTHVLSLGSM